MRGKRSTTSPKNAVFSTTCEYAAGMERGDRETTREKLMSGAEEEEEEEQEERVSDAEGPGM